MMTLPAQDAYELWAATYPPVAHNPLMRVEQDAVEPLLAHLRSTRALDMGTGSGRYLPVLEATGATSVLGIDFSLAMLRRGDARHGRVCGDARHLPFRRGAFDLINASLMVGDIADLGGWSREIARVLTPGGHLVYSDFHPSWAQRGWTRTFRDAAGALHDISFNAHSIEDHLAALAAAGFRVRTIREPRFNATRDESEPGIKAFRRRWGNPQVVAVFHAVKEP
jgi:SAM-dependent methyltransferase